MNEVNFNVKCSLRVDSYSPRISNRPSLKIRSVLEIPLAIYKGEQISGLTSERSTVIGDVGDAEM